MLSKFKTIFGWTSVGALVAYVSVATYYFTITLGPYVLMGNVPVSFKYSLLTGLVAGLLIGLAKAGLRVYIKED